MEEKGKVVTIESKEEEEDLHDLISEVEEGEDVDEDVPPMRSVAKLPEYVPLCKGKAKVPKDLDAMKSELQTPFLTDGINFEGPLLGHVPTLKFEDWYLTDGKKFRHLEMASLMKQSTKGPVINLEP